MQIQNYSYITYLNHRTSCWRIVHRPVWSLRRVHTNFLQRQIWIIWIIQRSFWRSLWRLERSIWNIHRGTSALSFNGRKIWRSHSCKLPLGGWTYMFQNCVSTSFWFKVILNVFYFFFVIRFVIGVIFVVIFLFFVNWKKCK